MVGGSRQIGRAPREAGVGFTLIEVLIVIAVIALLVAVLLPSLCRAKALAAQVLCQSHLRQWGVAFSTYATEFDGYYPHCDGWDRGSSEADNCGWIDVLPPKMGYRPWRDHPLYQRPGVGTIFQCPSAHLVGDDQYKYHPRREGYFSYAMNSCLELDGNCWWWMAGLSEPMPSFLATGRIERPAIVILLFDQLLDPHKGFDAKIQYRGTGRYCGSYPKAFSARHAGPGGALGGSILYCDGHVQWAATVWKRHWPADLEVPPRNDENWFPYPP